MNAVPPVVPVAVAGVAPPAPPLYGLSITRAQARAVLERAEAEARARGWTMVFVVVDSAAQLVALDRMDGVHHAAIAVAQAKAVTAVNFRRPTKGFEEAVAAGGAGLRFLAIPGLCPLEGGVPLLLDGRLVGAVGVSGTGSAEDGLVANLAASVLAGMA